MNIRKKTIIVGIVVLFLFGGLSLYSQYNFYYGKNKVLKHKFHWKNVETPHFSIYYYTPKRAMVDRIANAAEFSYERISDYLNVKVKKKIPLIFYDSHIDFEQTNLLGFVPQGVAAFAESTTYRVVVQGEDSFEGLARTITHEMSHIFEYEVLGRGLFTSRAPLWVMEGFSEHMAETWGDFYALTVRDAVLNQRIPQLQKNGELTSNYSTGRTPYDFGHAAYEFLEEKFGKRGIKQFLYSLRRGSLFRARSDILKPLNYTDKMFNFEFGKYLRNRFKKFKDKENPEDYSYIIGPDFPYAYSLSHQVSPSGEMLAVLTINRKLGKLDIILISMKDGKVIKSLTPGFTSRYDSIHVTFQPSDGSVFTWDKDNNKIAFFARKEFTDYLVIIDILSGKILKKIKIDSIQSLQSPNFVPGKNVIYFAGQQGTRSYIFSIDVDTKHIERLTDGRLFVKALNISPDGKRVVYSAQDGDYFKLYLAPLDNPGGAKRITDGDYNDITPVFSNDSKRIFYSSNELESYNINSIDLEKKILRRYTDVRTGNFFPVNIPGEEDHVVMSTYYKSAFSLYKKDISKPQDERTIQFEDLSEIPVVKKEIKPSKEIEIVDKGKYKPLKKLVIPYLPPIGISVGSSGGFWGYSSINLTDLLGDQQFSFLFSSMYGYQSYRVSYFNQANPVKLFASLFSYRYSYYLNYTGSASVTVYKMFGGEAGAYIPFNRSYRIEGSFSLYDMDQNYGATPSAASYGQFYSGMSFPVRVALTGETTRFSNYGPNMGHTFRLSYSKYIKLGSNFLDAYVIEGDFRKYFRLDNYSLLAFRLYGYTSGGKNPMIIWTGGNNTIRSIEINRWAGNHAFIFNAEFRFPLMHLGLTPIGVIGPVRGVFFFDLGGAWFEGQPFDVFAEGEGLKLKDAISSFGYGLEFFLFGYPMHVEWVWRTDLKKKYYSGVNFWIGFDF